MECHRCHLPLFACDPDSNGQVHYLCPGECGFSGTKQEWERRADRDNLRELLSKLSEENARLRERVKELKSNPWTALTDHQLDWIFNAVQGTYKEIPVQKKIAAERERRRKEGKSGE